MLGKTTNPLLQKTEQGIMQKVPQNLQSAVNRAVTAGLQVMYSGGDLQKQLTKSDDYAHNVGEGAAKLVGVLFHKSKNTMPASVAAPAATIFMCEGLDFLEKAGKIKVTPELLSETAQDLAANLLQLFGVDSGKIQQLAAQRQSKGLIQSAQGGQP